MTDSAGNGTKGECSPRSVFISYASSDQRSAERICAILEENGLSCWIAPRNVRPGRDYGDEIIRGIEASEGMVLLLSRAANSSKFVKREAERAVSKGKPVYVLRLEEVLPSSELELFVSGTHWIDAWPGDLEDHVGQLFQELTRPMESPSGEALASFPIGNSRKGWFNSGMIWGLLGLLVVVLLSGLGWRFLEGREWSSLREAFSKEAQEEVRHWKQMLPVVIEPGPALPSSVAQLEDETYEGINVREATLVYDLRENETQRSFAEFGEVYGTTLIKRLRIRKIEPVDQLRFDFMSDSAAEICVACLEVEFADRVRVVKQMKIEQVGDKHMHRRQVIVDISGEPLHKELKISCAATFWHDQPHEERDWAGIVGSQSYRMAQLFVLFAEDKPWKRYDLSIAHSKQDIAKPYHGAAIYYESEERTALGWQVIQPDEDTLYRVDWTFVR